MKNSSDIIGNRTRELPVCSAVSQSLRFACPLDCPVGIGNEEDRLSVNALRSQINEVGLMVIVRITSVYWRITH
jgi:hypothetical protein